MIKFNQSALFKPCTDRKTDFEKKKILKKIFNLMNSADFGKATENVKKNREANLAATERRRNYLVSEPKFHITLIIIKLISDRNEKNWNTYE